MRLSKSIRDKQWWKGVAIGMLLLIPLMLLIPGWDAFVFSPRSTFSDEAITHYPNALFLLDSIRHGQIAFWSPMIFGGYPFAADPLSGVWYLPGWLALLFPLPMGFHVTIFIHLFFSGIGMWLFLRRMGLGWLAAVGGAWAWELMPKIFAHYGAGHITLLYAVAWTPWLLVAERNFLERFTSQPSMKLAHHWRPSLRSGVVLAMMMLADIRWVAYAGLLWVGYSAWTWWGTSQGDRHWVMGWVWLRHAMVSVFIGTLLAAPLLLPLIEFTSLSTRSQMRLEDNLSLAIRPVQLFGFIAPDFGGYAEWAVYFGAAFSLILVWILGHGDYRKKTVLWLLVMAMALLFSLGSVFPPNQWLARLPGMDLLRVPSRFMLIFGFAAAVVTGYFLNFNPLMMAAREHFWGNLFAAGMVVFSWIITISLWLMTDSPPWPYLWGAVFLLLGLVVLVNARAGRLTAVQFQSSFILVLLLDLGAVAHSQFIYVEPAAVIATNRDFLALMERESEPFRVYSPSYTIPQQTAADHRIETFNGIDPLQLRSFARFFAEATGIPMDGYSVILPPFEEDDLATQHSEAKMDVERMGWFNVRFILTSFELNVADLTELARDGTDYLYLNQKFRPRAWMQGGKTIDTLYSEEVTIVSNHPNEIVLHATGPGTLVLSSVYYPGWQVMVDGKPAEEIIIESILQGVVLRDRDSHTVRFYYRPVWMYISMAAAVLGWIWVMEHFLCMRKKNDGR